MTATVESVKEVLRKMPAAQRAEIEQFLLDDTELPEDEAIAIELNRRIEAIERGTVQGIPAAKFLAELEAEYP